MFSRNACRADVIPTLFLPPQNVDFGPMSLAEIKHAVDELQPDERLELAEYVRWRTTQDDPEWQAEIRRRRERLSQSGGHTRDDLLRLHDKLSSEGK